MSDQIVLNWEVYLAFDRLGKIALINSSQPDQYLAGPIILKPNFVPNFEDPSNWISKFQCDHIPVRGKFPMSGGVLMKHPKPQVGTGNGDPFVAAMVTLANAKVADMLRHDNTTPVGSDKSPTHVYFKRGADASSVAMILTDTVFDHLKRLCSLDETAGSILTISIPDEAIWFKIKLIGDDVDFKISLARAKTELISSLLVNPDVKRPIFIEIISEKVVQATTSFLD